MKNRMILAAGIALALTTSAFAQDNTAPMPATQADQQTAPADSQPMDADAQPPMANTKHRTRHHRAGANSHMAAHMGAHMALTGDEPRIVAYQNSNRVKNYPAVDPGHVPGDPPVINHSHDQAGAPPTSTTVTVPPSH